jgi:Trk K+ transport system NAD-binding subunit
VLLALIYRNGRVLVPQGTTVLLPGDRVLLVAEGEAFERVRTLLTAS